MKGREDELQSVSDPKLPHLPAILSKSWNVMVDSDRRLGKPEEGAKPAGQVDPGEGSP